MATISDYGKLNDLLRTDMNFSEEKVLGFISAIKNINSDNYTELVHKIKKQVSDSKNYAMDLHNKLLIYLLFQFYVTAGFIMFILCFLK